MYFPKWLSRSVALLLAALLIFSAVLAVGTQEGSQEQEAAGTPLTSGLLEANSNRQIHPFSQDEVECQFTTDGFEQVGETESLIIYLNRDEAALRILNKKTGYLWGGVPVGEAEGLNSTWRCYGNGLASIECFSSEGAESRVSIGKNGSADYQIIESGLLCTASFEEYGISFTVKVTWAGEKVTAELVEGSLSEGLNGSAYTLKSMTFLPFLGSSYSDNIDGYILIPDGSGALIRYRQPANYSSTYAARIYGLDYGIDSLPSGINSTTKAEKQALMPIYGMVHGAFQNGYLAVVESGAEYATILATPAQKNNPYNWAAARFEFRQKYVKRINRKAGAGASMPQETPNALTPKISFYFVDGEQANYDGMAVLYRQLLLDQGALSPINIKGKAVPMQLEILGADKKNCFLWNTTSVFSTTQQAEEIVQKMAEKDITALNVVYRCYTTNNECGTALLPSLGSTDDFRQLHQTVEEFGGELYYYLDPITANEDQITLRTEAANSLSKVEINWVDPMPSTLYPNTYLYRLTEGDRRLAQAVEQEYGKNAALAQVTSKLYSDFTSGREVTRTQCLEQVLEMVDSLAGDGKLAMYQPNQYLWRYADKLYDLPISNSQLIYESDCVPFLQIVLSGCAELHGSLINTSSYSSERLLRQIEYGMAPAFAVTACDSMELYNTAQANYFSTNFEDWLPRIEETYRTVSEGLAPVWGHSILSHRCLENGLIRVGYDNGVHIYINYTDQTLTANGITVAAGSFAVAGR